ncbi:hypothetical protein EXW38_28980 (plasmid) [Bacillus mycoides]|nr:hypothetical protein EXW38_28980 [Bacillus mycoides]
MILLLIFYLNINVGGIIMKKVYFFAVIFVVITVLLNIFMQPIVDSIGIATMYIAILIFYALYALSFIIIADTAKWITKGGIGGMYRRRKKDVTIYQWTGSTKDLDKQLKILIGCKKVSGDVIDNMGVLKERIRYYFKDDKSKVKRFKAYLNVVEKDSTPIVIQTFIMAIFSSAFASTLVTGNIKHVIQFFIPISKDGVGIEISGLFYYTTGVAFLLILIMIMISFLISFTDRTRIRIIQEAIEIYLDENEKPSI